MTSIYDVAKRAGVAPKTVARALNGDAPVKAATRERIVQAAADLGYVPSKAARAMRSNRSGLVGLVTGAISAAPADLVSAGLPDLFILQGVQRAFEAADMTLLISDTSGRADRVPGLFRTLQEHRVEGLLYVAPHHQKIARPEPRGSTPLVLVNCFDDEGTPAIVPDDEAGEHALVARLITFGHRRIGYLTLPHAIIAHRLRLAGYKRALAEAGIPFDAALVRLADASGAPEETVLLDAALGVMLSLKRPPTVLCCGNDRLAMKAYGMVRARGLRIPEDIGIAGYDDHQIISEALFPPLTTAELPYFAMGERAGALLLSLMRGGRNNSEPTPEKVGGAVKWRHSVRSLDEKIQSLTSA